MSQDVQVDVEFPNWPKGSVPSPEDIPDYSPPKEDKQPLNDYVDDRALARPPGNPDAIDVPAPAPGNRISSIDDHIPHYGDTPDYLEAQQSQAMAPATTEIGHHMLGIVTGVYDDIKRFMETGDEKAAIRVAGALATGGTFAAEKNAVGAFGSHLNPKQRDYIKEMREEGKSAKEIADTMTRYHTPPGVEMTEEQVNNQLKKMGLSRAEKQAGWSDAMQFDLKAYDTPIFGVRPTYTEVTKAMMNKYPNLTEAAISNKLDKQRALARFKTEEAPAGKKLNEDSGLSARDSISKSPDQLEMDFQYATKPQQQQAKAHIDKDVQWALQDWQKATAKAKKGDMDPEEVRLLALRYSRMKVVSETMWDLWKDSTGKSNFPKNEMYTEGLKSRLGFFQDEVKKVEEQLSLVRANKNEAQQAPVQQQQGKDLRMVEYPGEYGMKDIQFLDKDGRPHIKADITLSEDGRTLNVESIYGLNAKGSVNSFGPEQIRDVIKQMIQKYPTVENIVGERVSGARAKAGADIPFKLDIPRQGDLFKGR